MANKIVPPRRVGKRSELDSVVAKAEKRGHPQAAEARAFLAKHAGDLPPANLRSADLLEGELQSVAKKQRDRDREKYDRTGKRRRVRTQRTRAVKPSNDDLWAIQGLKEHSGDKYWATITPKHWAMINGLRDLLERASHAVQPIPEGLFDEEDAGLLKHSEELRRKHVGEAPSGALADVERAYLAAFQWPVDRLWQWHLRHELEYALSKRLRPASDRAGWPGRDSGEQIVRSIIARAAPFVPAALAKAGPKVEKILMTATLGAGGGPSRTKNVRAAARELVEALGEEPFEPPSPDEVGKRANSPKTAREFAPPTRRGDKSR